MDEKEGKLANRREAFEIREEVGGRRMMIFREGGERRRERSDEG